MLRVCIKEREKRERESEREREKERERDMNARKPSGFAMRKRYLMNIADMLEDCAALCVTFGVEELCKSV